jgi:hypothetical protein
LQCPALECAVTRLVEDNQLIGAVRAGLFYGSLVVFRLGDCESRAVGLVFVGHGVTNFPFLMV